MVLNEKAAGLAACENQFLSGPWFTKI